MSEKTQRNAPNYDMNRFSHWVMATNNTTLSLLVRSFPFYAAFIFPLSIVAGSLAWMSFKDAKITLDQLQIYNSKFEFEYSIWFYAFIFIAFISLIIFGWFNLYLLNIDRSKTFTEEQKIWFERSKKSLKKLPVFTATQMFVIVIYFICFGLFTILVSNFELNGVVLNILTNLNYILILFGLYLLFAAIFWPIEISENDYSLKQFYQPVIDSQKEFTGSKVLSGILRMITLFFLSYLYLLAFSSLSELIISIFGINNDYINDPVSKTTLNFDAQWLLGSSIAVTILKSAGAYLGFVVASITWLTGLKYIQEVFRKSKKLKPKES